jgi:Peptidase family S41
LSRQKSIPCSRHTLLRVTPDTDLNASYTNYLKRMLTSDTRPEFDLATIEFVAQLHNGHTFFWDASLDKSNQPLGFYAAPLGGYWIVQSNFLAALKPGDIIVSIDNVPTEAFFQQQQKNIAASSTAAQRHNLFLLPYLFPEQFMLTLDGDRKVRVDREKLKVPEQKTEGRWLKPGVTAYIRILAFFHPPFEQAALDYIRQYQNARTLIIDVRNNGGGIPPRQLIEALMDRPTTHGRNRPRPGLPWWTWTMRIQGKESPRRCPNRFVNAPTHRMTTFAVFQ